MTLKTLTMTLENSCDKTFFFKWNDSIYQFLKKIELNGVYCGFLCEKNGFIRDEAVFTGDTIVTPLWDKYKEPNVPYVTKIIELNIKEEYYSQTLFSVTVKE